MTLFVTTDLLFGLLLDNASEAVVGNDTSYRKKIAVDN